MKPTECGVSFDCLHLGFALIEDPLISPGSSNKSSFGDFRDKKEHSQTQLAEDVGAKNKKLDNGPWSHPHPKRAMKAASISDDGKQRLVLA